MNERALRMQSVHVATVATIAAKLAYFQPQQSPRQVTDFCGPLQRSTAAKSVKPLRETKVTMGLKLMVSFDTSFLRCAYPAGPAATSGMSSSSAS